MQDENEEGGIDTAIETLKNTVLSKDFNKGNETGSRSNEEHEWIDNSEENQEVMRELNVRLNFWFISFESETIHASIFQIGVFNESEKQVVNKT
jgi:hypothetical protein